MAIIMMIRTYTEMLRYPTWEERFNYLKLHGVVANETFGIHRYLNQKLYRSMEWKQLRNQIIFRDNGCDLAARGYEIQGKILIHHMNPITFDDLDNMNPCVFDPENLISVSYETHNAIHYGSLEYAKGQQPVERTPNDTCPWRK